jgi:hypothetical protein
MKSGGEATVLSYATPGLSNRRQLRLDGPANLDIGAALCAGLLIVTVEMFGAGGSNKDWWMGDWHSYALFCFYRVLESLIAGLPASAFIIRALRFVRGRSVQGNIWWIGIAAVSGFIFWYAFLVDSLMCHI